MSVWVSWQYLEAADFIGLGIVLAAAILIGVVVVDTVRKIKREGLRKR